MRTWNPQANDLFLQALALPSAEERQQFLDGACAADAALRAEVESLLLASIRAGSFLESPHAVAEFTVASPHEGEIPGVVIGPYKLLEQIGEGGFGVVFMAEQKEPMRRKVALKVLKPGMDTKQVVARFEAERQALAMMDHPNIAKILDAGTTGVRNQGAEVRNQEIAHLTPDPCLLTPGGRPYFVMELIKGQPITHFCDENRLTPRQRLSLFIDVCAALQHAHQKGIIHRDLKPTNVLVASHDGIPVAKVIDFGIAKAIGQQLTDKTIYTQLAQLVGTPLYMSPEQAGQSGLDVDTRSDIYSLGVLLYELLAGSTPFPKDRFKQAAYDEIRRIIREEDPPKPSTRLSDSKDALPSIAAHRQTEPAKLTKLVRGELDWIVMKALEKDRNRRYESASAFAADVQRYLADEPVEACPPSVGYRLRKFVRRNRGAVVAAASIFFFLVSTIVGTTVGMIQAKRAKDVAEKRLDQIEKGIGVLGSLFADLDPFAEEKEGRQLRVILGERLDQAAATLEGDAVGDPLVVAKLQERLGETYLGLGHADRAEALFTKVVAIRRIHLDTDHPLTLVSLHNQALAHQAAGRHLEAIKRFEKVWDLRVKVLGADHLDTLTSLNKLAVSYWLAGKPTDAIPKLEQVRDERVNQLGESHEHTLTTLEDLAGAYLSANKYREAIALNEKVLAARVKKHGEDHPHAIAALARLAYAYQRGYKMSQALALFEQARDKTVPRLGADHPLTLKILFGLAHMYRVTGKTSKAIALFEQVREKQVMVLGGNHPHTIQTVSMLALAYQDSGEVDKAMPLFEQAASAVERIGYAHDDAERIFHNVASRHEQMGHYRQAEVWRRKWVPVVKERLGPESLEYAGFRGLAGLGSNLVQQKKYTDAEPIVRESLAILQKNNPEGWDTFRAQSLLGAALLGQQRYAEAKPHLDRGYQGMKKLAKALDRQNLTEAVERLVQLYDSWGKA